MRRQNRRVFNEEKETNKIVYISLAVLIIAILAFGLTFIIYSNYLNNDTKIAEFKTTTIKELEELNKQSSSEASSGIGKTVNEVQEENINEEKSEPIKIAINTTNMEKETVEEEKEERKITKETSIEVAETKLEEKIPDPTFIKPVEGEIIVEFAKENLVYSNTLQEWVTHNGIDIKAEKTTVVKASAEGEIKSIKNDPRYGITVVIEHVNGYTSIYSNLLTAEFVKEGEKVKQGQTIGTVGNTATFEIADETHLHFEILKDNEYVNPNLYIK